MLVNKEQDSIVMEFRDLLAEKQTDEETTTFFKSGIFDEEESPAEKYLTQLDYKDFFYVLNAWDIGRDMMNSREIFYERLESFEDQRDLFSENLKEIKQDFISRTEAESYFLEKKESLIKQQLDNYIYEFSLFA